MVRLWATFAYTICEDHFQSNVGSVTWATVFPKATPVEGWGLTLEMILDGFDHETCGLYGQHGTFWLVVTGT